MSVNYQFLTSKPNKDERSGWSVCLLASLPFGRSSVPGFVPPQGEVQA